MVMNHPSSCVRLLQHGKIGRFSRRPQTLQALPSSRVFLSDFLPVADGEVKRESLLSIIKILDVALLLRRGIINKYSPVFALIYKQAACCCAQLSEASKQRLDIV